MPFSGFLSCEETGHDFNFESIPPPSGGATRHTG
jgi:hypothetical protein